MTVKIIFVAAFFAMLATVGVLSRKKVRNTEGFILGGRKIGPWLSAFSYGASYFSAVVFIGYAGQFGWRYGLSATWIGIGNALIGSLLAWVVLGKRTRAMTGRLKTATMPQFFEKRYGSRALKLVASAIIFIFLVPYTASVYNGLSKLFAMAFGIDFIYCIIGIAALSAFYVILGGYVASSLNDFIQGLVMLFGILAVIAAVLAQFGGLSAAVGDLSKITDDGGGFTSLFGSDPLSLLSVVILTSLGPWGLPQMVHKFYSIKDKRAIKAGTVISTVFALVVAGGSYFLGGFGRLAGGLPGVVNPETGAVAFDTIVPTMVSLASNIIVALVVVLVLAASISTLSSLVLSSSSTLALDFISGTLVKDMSEKKKMATIRVLIGVFILISVLIAANPGTFIAQLMGISWGALAGSFLAPFLYGLFWKRATKAAVWASFASGVGITVTAMLTKNLAFVKASPVLAFVTGPINAGAIAMLAGLVIVPVASLLSKAPEQRVISSAFDENTEKTGEIQ